MEKLYRMIDANINRASEGLRVLEDLARFHYDDGVVSAQLKIIRHGIRKNVMEFLGQCLTERNSQGDVGLPVSRELKLDHKSTFQELITANFKRAQEALRVVEENLKLLGKYDLSKVYESFRFEAYQLEKSFFTAGCARTKIEKLQTDLYCITAEEHSRGRSNLEVVPEMIRAGIRIIQYREKDKSMGQKYRECLQIRELTEKAGVAFIVNDHPDIAISVKADGVHIGQEDMPIEKVRELAGPEMIIGLSTHSPQQARDAVKRGADYIGVGPLFRTFTKKDVCEPVGLEYLDYAVKNVTIPFVAIGGIKKGNMDQVAAGGAKCMAMVTEIVGAEDICGKIQKIRARLKGE